MYSIVDRRELALGNMVSITVGAPKIAAKIRPGQFVVLRISETGERMPLTVAYKNLVHGTITIIFQVVGKTTAMLASLKVGDAIKDLVGPLGCMEEFHKVGTVVGIGGGSGIAVLHHLMQGYGLVTDALKQLVEEQVQVDLVMAVGPLIMMRAVCDMTRLYGINTWVSLNPIMIDATGMCGGCRVSVGNKTRFACVDGPHFNGHEVDFDELMQRNNMYQRDEKQSLLSSIKA